MKITETFSNSPKIKASRVEGNFSITVLNSFYKGDDKEVGNADYLVVKESDKMKIVARLPNRWGEQELGFFVESLEGEINYNNIVKKVEQINGLSFERREAPRKSLSTVNKNKGGGYTPKGNNYKRNDDIEQIPIFMIIEMLASQGYIDIIDDLEKNGKEVKYRFTISESNKDRVISDNFIVSVVGEDNYQEEAERAMYYVDFKGYFEKDRGSAGEINFLKDLERYGAFGKPEVLSKNPSEEEQREYNKKVFIKVNDVLRKIKSNIGNDFDYVKRGSGLGIRFSEPDVMPAKIQKNEKLKPVRDFIGILKYRGFSDEIIEDSFKSGLMYFGKTISKKKGYQPTNLIFPMFDLVGSKFPVSYEYCFPLRNNGEAPIKMDKIFASIKRVGMNNDNIMTGSYFGVSFDRADSYNNKGTVISEALLDSIAVKQLMGYSGIERGDYNHIALQGVGNVINLLKETFGFYYKKSDDEAKNEYRCGDVYRYEKTIEESELTDEVKGKLKEKIEGKKIKFIFDKSKKGSNFQLEKLNKFLKEIGAKNKIDVIEVKYRAEKINEESLVGENVLIFDNTNVDKFFEQNKLIFNKGGKFKFLQESVVDEKVEDPNILKEYGERIRRVLGSKKIILAFDNDTAGMNYGVGFYEMSKKIGIECTPAIPYFHIYRKNDGSDKLINDNNDILMFANHLLESGKITKQGLSEWLNKTYFSQFEKVNGFENGKFEESLEMAKKIKSLETKIKDGGDLMVALKDYISKKKNSEKNDRKSGRHP
tara:strand:- start:3731 stop:6022 length:2292 start_codon:yes stop_codon:yes gene_type:complete